MGNNKIIFAQFSKIAYFYDPNTKKNLENTEKGCKDVKYLPTFPTVSKLNRVSVCELMDLVTNRVRIACDNDTSGCPLPPPPPPSQILVVMTRHLLRLRSRNGSESILSCSWKDSTVRYRY